MLDCIEIQEAITGSRNSHISPLWDKPYPEEIRRLLQWWGTEFRRAQDIDYWATRGIEEAMRQAEHQHLVVITDVRFENEAHAIRAAGGVVFEVVATTATRQERLGGELPPEHASEVMDFAVDGYIENHGGPNYEDTPAISQELWDFIA